MGIYWNPLRCGCVAAYTTYDLPKVTMWIEERCRDHSDKSEFPDTVIISKDACEYGAETREKADADLCKRYGFTRDHLESIRDGSL